VAESAKSDGTVPDVCLVSEIDLEDGNVANDRGADCGDEEEDGGNEEEGHPDPGALSVRFHHRDGGMDGPVSWCCARHGW